VCTHDKTLILPRFLVSLKTIEEMTAPCGTHAVAWCVPGWANEAFQYAAMDSKTMNVSFAKGGYQMSRQ